ncbi:hypothetical protein DS66_05000 [Mesotoga sp. SC_3PWM13N19]|nr:hypothetical protein DS66_05000 [Mesotoga sp. SC_3PWM13N19]
MNLKEFVLYEIMKGSSLFENSIVELLNDAPHKEMEVKFLGSIVKSTRESTSTILVYELLFEEGFEVLFSSEGCILLYRVFGNILANRLNEVNFPDSIGRVKRDILKTIIVNENAYFSLTRMNPYDEPGGDANTSYLFGLDEKPTFYEVLGKSPDSTISRMFLETSKLKTLWF